MLPSRVEGRMASFHSSSSNADLCHSINTMHTIEHDVHVDAIPMWGRKYNPNRWGQRCIVAGVTPALEC